MIGTGPMMNASNSLENITYVTPSNWDLGKREVPRVHLCMSLPLQPLKFWQPEMWRCVKHVACLHLVFQPLGLPVFYAIMKWRGMPFSGPAPPL